MSQFNIDEHSLEVGEIPQHRHGISHGHSGVTINSFTGNNGDITVSTGANGGTHNHQINDDGHMHFICGGGNSDDVAVVFLVQTIVVLMVLFSKQMLM